MVRPRTSSAKPAMYLIWLVARPMSLRISCSGLPLSSESSRDSSSPRASIASAKASSAAARSWGSVERQLGAAADLVAGLEAERPGERSQIRVGVGDGLADPGVPGRPLALPGHPLLVHHVVEVEGVVRHHDHQRPLV